MLVLSRKRNESLVIDDRITVTVVDIRPDKVRLGIAAPKEVPVHRQEVSDAIHRRGDPQPVTPAQAYSDTVHPSEEALAEYARFAVGHYGLPNPSTDFLHHLRGCQRCRHTLGTVIITLGDS